MSSKAIKKEPSKQKLILLSIIFVWALYVFIYSLLKNNADLEQYSPYFPLAGESGLDILAAALTFNLWRKSRSSENKSIFSFFCLGFFSAIIADTVYNVVLNLMEFQYINPLVVSLFDVPFLLFLLFQALTWGKILISNKDNTSELSKLSYIPYLAVSLLMLIMFMFGITWKIGYFSLVGIFQAVDTILEVIGFYLATICLARSENYFIKFTSIGYLLIVASDFIIRYNVVSGIIPYLSSFESTWILGLALMCFGFFSIKSGNDKKCFKLSEINSLQSQIGIWLLVWLWLISVLMFISVYYLLSPSTEFHLKQIAGNFLSMLVPFSVLAIVSSSYISTKISAPLSRLEQKINTFINSEAVPDEMTSSSDKGFIYEFKLLEKFVFDAFLLYQKKHLMDRELSQLATQVAHDIRSPLMVINIATMNMSSESEPKRSMIKNAAQRINDIANNMLVQAKESFHDAQAIETPVLSAHEQISPEFMLGILESIVSEKRYEYHDSKINIRFNTMHGSYDSFSAVNSASFKRVLSNLINNSIEAMESDGLLEVTLQKLEHYIEIKIKDNGCGIPEEILPKITSQGFSYNKKNGTGIGLSFAKQYIEQIHGKLSLDSMVGVGTTVTILLPKSSTPNWFCNVLPIMPQASILVLDDDPGIHAAWRDKFAAWLDLQMTHFFKAADLSEATLNSINPNVCLVDYELMQDNKNGLDVIETLRLQDKAILVTSAFEDPSARQRAVQLGVRILPKCFVPYVEMTST